MALQHTHPNKALERELLDVARDSNALLEFFRAPNAIPDSFPTRQVVEICESLAELPQGTAEGCRAPLEYARVRLPAIRREHVFIEDQVQPLADEDELPPLTRGMGLDRLLRDLMASVITCLDEYRLQATEHFDDTVGPEPYVDVPDEASIRLAVAKSQSVEKKLHNAGRQIGETTFPESVRADQLRRTVKDAESLNRVARAELGMKSVVLRWFRAVVDALNDYPKLIQRFGDAIVVGVDVAQPLNKRWSDFWTNLANFGLDELRETGSMFAEVGSKLEKRRSRAATQSREGRIDPRQVRAEHEARQLILAGQPVPPRVASLAKNLDLSGTKIAPTYVPDFGLVAQLSGLTKLIARHSNVSSLDFVSSLIGLKELAVNSNEASDLSPLAGLSGLTWLSVRANQASDLSPLAGLTNLTSLTVHANQASDLSPLAGLTNLRTLSVQANQASDLSPLAGLTNLTSLTVHANQASDLSPLAALTNLIILNISGCRSLRDLHPLQLLKKLVSLKAKNTSVTDFSHVSHVPTIITN